MDVEKDDILMHGGVPVVDILQIEQEISSVAIDWKTIKNIKECVCSTPFDHFSRKVSFYFNMLTQIELE